jgi:D-alanyl-D-alanine carboxypeptidase
MFSGSIGKTYVAALVLRLVEMGILNLEAPITTYLAERPWLKRLPNADAITVHHLLQHTSGLPEYVENEALWTKVASEPDKRWTPEDRLTFVFDHPALFKPGMGFSYADTNFILLGAILEGATGRRYEDLATSMLLQPLGLKETAFADQRYLVNLPIGYSTFPPLFHLPTRVIVQGRYCFNPQLEWTGGGYYSTAADLARWGASLYGGRVLSAPLLQALIDGSGHIAEMGPGVGYGLGTIIWKSESGELWGHSGFVPGFNGILQYDPKTRITLALLCNSDTALKGRDRTPHLVAKRLWGSLRAMEPSPTSKPSQGKPRSTR